MKPSSRLDPVPELAEQGNVLCDPPSTSGPIADGSGIPLDAKVFEMFEHCDAGCTSGALWTVEMEVSCEVARAQEARQMRVIDPRGQVIHCSVKNWVQTGVGFFLSCAGHHPNIPTELMQSDFESRTAGLEPGHNSSLARKRVAG
jgi:hypothetical protein